MRKSALFSPGADMTPQERKRRQTREAERQQASAPTWRETWKPLPPSAPRFVRAGALDFLALPSVIGTRKD